MNESEGPFKKKRLKKRRLLRDWNRRKTKKRKGKEEGKRKEKGEEGKRSVNEEGIIANICTLYR